MRHHAPRTHHRIESPPAGHPGIDSRAPQPRPSTHIARDRIARRIVSGCTPAISAAAVGVNSTSSPAARRSASRASTRSASRSIV